MYKVGDRVIVTNVQFNYADCIENDTGTIVKVNPFGPQTYLVKVDNPTSIITAWAFQEHQLLPILSKGLTSKWNH